MRHPATVRALTRAEGGRTRAELLQALEPKRIADARRIAADPSMPAFIRRAARELLGSGASTSGSFRPPIAVPAAAPSPATSGPAPSRRRPTFISLTERPVADIRARTQPPGLAAIRAPEQRGFVHKRVLGFLGKQVIKRIPGGQVALDIGKGIRSSLQQQKRPAIALPGLGPGGPAPLGFAPAAVAPASQVALPALAVVGAFDMPAIVPLALQRVTLDCPPGMVLGMDDLCYPSAVLRRNSRFRKWRSPPRPTITRRDERALGRIDAVRKDIKTLGKKAGLKVLN